MADPAVRNVKIWDAPVRLFHWLLVLLVTFSFISGEFGGMDVTVPKGLPNAGAVIPNIELHKWSGLAILTLVLFRIGWGFFGSGTAQFASFVRGPRHVLRYLKHMFSRERADFMPGHNPAGAVIIVLVLALLLLHAGTGLFLRVDDDFFPFTAPLNHLVSARTAKLLLNIHGLCWTLIQVLIVLHIVAILYYWLFRRENLIGAMFTGHRKVPPGVPTPTLTFAPTLLALLALLVSAAIVWAVVSFA
jgi:cytochrome b